MIREKVKFQELISVVTDALTVFISYVLAVYIRYEIMDSNPGLDTLSAPYLLIAAAYSIIIASVLSFIRQSREAKTGEYSDYGLFSTNAIGCLVLLAFLYIIGELYFSRWALILFWLISSVFLIFKSMFMTRMFDKKQFELTKNIRVVVVGSGDLTRDYINSICWDSASGFNIVGYVGDKSNIFFDYDFDSADGVEDVSLKGWLGDYADFESIIKKVNPNEVVFALEDKELVRLPELISIAKKYDLKAAMVPSFNKYIPSDAVIRRIDEIKVIDFCPPDMEDSSNGIYNLGLTLSAVVLTLMLVIKMFKIGNLKSFGIYETYRNFLFAMAGFFLFCSLKTVFKEKKYANIIRAMVSFVISTVVIIIYELFYPDGVKLMSNIMSDLKMTSIVIVICWIAKEIADYVSKDDSLWFY